MTGKRHEILAETEVEPLSEAWAGDEEEPEGGRVIRRIEELPRLEDIGSNRVEWDIDGLFVRASVNLITGEAGSGKSTLLSAAGYCISNGEPFLGRATVLRPVLILDAENPHVALVERFQRLGIETHDNFRVWGQWVGEDPPAAGGAIVLEWVERCEPKPFIVVDSLIAFHPGAENDSSETRKYLAQYRRLSALGATIALLHHVGKSEASRDYRGSSDIKASIDVGYKLTNLGDGARLSLLELRAFKQRFSVTPRLTIRYDNGDFLIDDREPPQTVAARLSRLLKQCPGVNSRDFERRAIEQNLGRNRARDFLKDGISNGTIRTEAGEKNRKKHFASGSDVSELW